MDDFDQPSASALEIDEDLTLIERIERFCASGALVQRLVHVKELSSCAEQVGVAEAVGRLVPLLRVIVCDPDLSVRQALAEQMIPFATLLLTEPDTRAPGELSGDERGGLTAYECVLQELVPLLTSILGSGPQELSGAAATNNLPLSEAASDALLGLAGLIKPADVGETVLRAVLCLAHDNEIEENRVVATQLLGSLAPVLGPELCRQYVLPDLVCLADDPAFRVRKAAAMRVGAVSTVVGPELTVAKLLPVFEVLARDEIWGVRKASVESLAQVAAVMPLDVRVGSLEKLMHEFHGDSSRWVRISACQALGPFIATLPSEAISTSLLSLFTQLANPTSPTAADSDVAYSCAYNFPGVAQAVGASRWSEIAESFATLAGNIQWKVRRTLSCSLHDLAAVLGSELTETELLPTFDLFIKDLDEVKVGVIQNLAAFIAALTPATRLTYLPVLSDIRAETDNWRFRHLLASQLAAFGAAFPRGAVQETLLPLALALCTDSVAEVRVAGIAQIGKLVKLLVPENSSAATPAAAAEKAAVATGADGELEAASPDSVVDSPSDGRAVSEFVDTIIGMARAPSCYKRANCVQICSSLIEGLPMSLVEGAVLPQLLPLCTDRVANVRLALAELLKTRLICDGSVYANLPITMELCERLRVDTDRDVLRAAHASDSYEPPPYRCKPPPPTALHSAFMGSEEGMGGLEEEDEEEEDEEEEDEAMGPAAALPEVGDEEDGEEDNDALTQGAMAAAMAALRVHEEAAELDVEPDLGARME